MSSTETTESETSEEVTGASADDLASLNTDQLDALLEQHKDDPNTVAALQAVIDERKKIEAQIKAQGTKSKAPKEPAKSRKGSRNPKGRQVTAAKSFNADPANLERLKRVLEGDPNHDPPIPPVINKDADGKVTYVMTEWFIQLGISGYYDERRNEGTKPKAKAAGATPIIPAPEATASAPAGEAPSEAPSDTVPPVIDMAGSDEATPAVESVSAAEGTDQGEDQLPPQAKTPFPANPYQPDEDDG